MQSWPRSYMQIPWIAPCNFICKQNVSDHKDGESTMGYGKMHTGNIVLWAHPKCGSSGMEQIDGMILMACQPI